MSRLRNELRYRSAIACLLSLLWCVDVRSPLSAAPPSFVAETIDGQIAIGYGLAIGEVDGDGRPDILLADKEEIVWYQNPGTKGDRWRRHVMARRLTPRDNVCIAARDITGDGLVEVAVGANWNPGETDDPTRSGAIFYLERPDDPTRAWNPVSITPHDPTVHRMHWIRRSDATFQLLVLPLHGRGNRNGQGEEVRLMAYTIPLDMPNEATHEVLYQGMHMTHNFDVVQSDSRQPEDFLLGGREGIVVGASQTESMTIPAPANPGAGEVRLGHMKDTVLVAIEPMHGTSVVVYSRGTDARWGRRVIDETLRGGHALAAGDLLGQGIDQIVAGWREPDAVGRVGIRLYKYNQESHEWSRHVIDDHQMACEDLKLADLNGDGRLDIVAAGRATNNLIVYWNQSE